MSGSRNNRVVGGGLLRLLADTSVLLYKTKHICWRADGPLEDGLRSVIREYHAALSATADDIAQHIIDLGVSIPEDFADVAAMSSIKPAANVLPIAEAIAGNAGDHRMIAADIETLRVTLPLEGDSQTIALLDRLAEHHDICWKKLKDLLPKAGETTH